MTTESSTAPLSRSMREHFAAMFPPQQWLFVLDDLPGLRYTRDTDPRSGRVIHAMSGRLFYEVADFMMEGSMVNLGDRARVAHVTGFDVVIPIQPKMTVVQEGPTPENITLPVMLTLAPSALDATHTHG